MDAPWGCWPNGKRKLRSRLVLDISLSTWRAENRRSRGNSSWGPYRGQGRMRTRRQHRHGEVTVRPLVQAPWAAGGPPSFKRVDLASCSMDPPPKVGVAVTVREGHRCCRPFPGVPPACHTRASVSPRTRRRRRHRSSSNGTAYDLLIAPRRRHRRRLRQTRRFGTNHPRSNDALICQLPLIKAPRETNISSTWMAVHVLILW